jgi:hypothetical protein
MENQTPLYESSHIKLREVKSKAKELRAEAEKVLNVIVK